jgi:hypothetical protein
MNQIRVSDEKKMTVTQRKEQMPYELLSDGQVFAVVRDEKDVVLKGKVTCPNCKFEVELPKKDDSPAPFSVQHP